MLSLVEISNENESTICRNIQLISCVHVVSHIFSLQHAWTADDIFL
ncbi:hypothetical protein Pint_26780 [Pistacia integerrima]|uniref:Uncharacterized protein n=2 Tax=Pistacia integerrima TaxID=434235 RepID=A0ACC0YPE3_9ROSI|nr:hypothetical protein Pint_26779 [Pistacia integerrima]KAJ0040944.1 hypothetical protein Pint_26780 [Pistacia integerrima]